MYNSLKESLVMLGLADSHSMKAIQQMQNKLRLPRDDPATEGKKLLMKEDVSILCPNSLCPCNEMLL